MTTRVLLSLAACWILNFAQGESPTPPTKYDGYVLESNVMVPMRDGVKLATDIYRPAKGGVALAEALPLILRRTPYDKRLWGSVESAAFFCRHGYIVVHQDCRGRFASEGAFTKYVNEPYDGYDTVEWLAIRPYSNGKIGMWGTSYSAHVQAAAAKLNPPHLSTIVVTAGGTSNGWNHGIRNHGAFALKQLTWAFSNLRAEADDPVVKAYMESQSIADWFQALPLKRGSNPLSIAPEFENYYFDMLDHSDYSDYWKQMGFNWMEYYSQTSDIPMIHIAGWYDNYCQTAIDNYAGLSKRKRSPVHLLMGPWVHGGIEDSHAGDVEFGEAAAINGFDQGWHLRWFDRFLKGVDSGLESAKPVRIFVMGTGDGRRDENGRLFHGGYWMQTDRWPVPEAKPVQFYLRASGDLSTDLPETEEGPITYRFDPADPVPTIGGSMAASRLLWEGGAFHQKEKPFDGDPSSGFYGSRPPYLPLKARHDVVVYQTKPLEKAVTVAGPVIVKLQVSSDCPDTDFTAKLIDVYPPSQSFTEGFEMNLTDGIMRARYRNDPSKQEFMDDGKIYELTIEPFPTANVFKKGHRIRIDVSSSNFPRFDVNPNTGEPIGQNRRFRIANNTIHHSQRKPSSVTLWMLPD